jgi:phage/plasmid-like protein (TIGR03299 family)
MAHELEEVNGKIEAAFALKTPWHGLGNILDYVPNSEQMIEAAGLNWEVELNELQNLNGQSCGDYRGIFRKDVGNCLGIVSSKYKPVQNREAFDFLDSLLQDGVMKYESAGAIRGGKIVWALARFPSYSDEIAQGDTLERYVMFSTSHDGTGAIYAIPTSVRVVCANTHRIAIRGHKGIKHYGNMDQKLNQAKMLISQFDEGFTLYVDKAKELAQREVDSDNTLKYLDTLYPPIEEDGSAKTRRTKKIDLIMDNLSNPRNALPAIKGTWWSLYNAVSENVDHQSSYRGKEEGKKEENRFISLIDGNGADDKNTAFDLAVEMAGV